MTVMNFEEKKNYIQCTLFESVEMTWWFAYQI